MKVCARCNIPKETEEFNKNGQQKDGKHVYCKTCVSLYAEKYYGTHKEKILGRSRNRRLADPEKNKKFHRDYRIKFPDRIRNSRLLKAYGINLETWNALFDSQEKCCAICRTENPGARGWNTDHNHTTGKVRGILCSGCNIGLGLFKDDIKSLLRTVEYLRKASNTKDDRCQKTMI